MPLLNSVLGNSGSVNTGFPLGNIGSGISSLFSSFADHLQTSVGQNIDNLSTGVSDALANYNVDSDIVSDVPQGLQPQAYTISQYINAHPGASAEQILNYMAKHSDEYAEMYMNYLLEQGQLDAANAYTAEREDTAYQRLVQDLKAAGLNPAMMYGSSAGTYAGGSQGYIKMSEGASSRDFTRNKQLQELILKTLVYELQTKKFAMNSILSLYGSNSGLLGKILGAVL